MDMDVTNKDAQSLAVWLGEQGIPPSICEIFEGDGYVCYDTMFTCSATGAISSCRNTFSATFFVRVNFKT